ncbi:flagellar assembly protein FliH [Cellvibrio sp. PSBB006]|uniref:flagellar assembly protein FliH n=1 Tax=Cellvibrio sp. PSBB006 TaxID=1987723 RepID=UPI000B3B298E|nr:flagellar assembly protein FliH [Cellvibrio sp. PSBB006]ARU26859.1 flagellar assembly protein FliH [Cellvibrio sp. PSBB006]
MEKKLPNRIAAEDVGEYRAWRVPLINDNGTVMPSAEKEARERKAQAMKRQGESIEDVDMPSATPKKGMTAQEMQEIIEAAEKDGFAQGHQEGFDKGMAEGYEAGQQKGLMEMRQQLVTEQQRFQKLVQALLDPIAEQDNDLEKLLLDVICTLTESVVQRELIIDSSHIVTLVRTAVNALPVGSKNLRVCLNPDDLAAVETYAEEQQLNWQFVGDEQLAPGGCRVETSESRVDFSVEKRLQTVLTQFVNKQLTDNNGDADDDISLADDADGNSLNRGATDADDLTHG